jgi:hypothetical protein
MNLLGELKAVTSAGAHRLPWHGKAARLVAKWALAMLAVPASLAADCSPLAVALTRDFQFPGHETAIHGLSLALFEVEHNQGLQGIGIAIGGQDVSEVSGIQISGVINSSGDVDGVQVAGLVNMAGSFQGAMISGYVNIGGAYRSRHSRGLQLAIFGNQVEFMGPGEEGPTSLLDGAQISLAFNGAHHLRGAQISILGNDATRCSGLQLGLVNHAKELRGVQVGLCNLARSGFGVQLGLVNGFGSGDDRLWLPVVNARF